MAPPADGKVDVAPEWLGRQRGSKLVAVTSVLERLMPLWTQPVDAWPDPVAAFGEVYANPVLVNGAELALPDLISRARDLQRAFDGLSMQILDMVEAPGRIVIAFLMRGRHTGPFVSPVGTIAPTHRDIEVRTIDVLALTAGVISSIWVVSDELGLLRQLSAITLA
jgi:predicted ester cyclase